MRSSLEWDLPAAAAYLRRCGLLLSLLLIVGCGSSPYAASESGSNTFYSTYMAPPAHLDPARGDPSFGSLVSLDIYEPPLQYHFLKRPFALVPLTAAAEPACESFDAAGGPIPCDAPADRVARVVYTVRIRPGIRFQQHPCFARDEQGRPRHSHLTEADLAGITSVHELPGQGTRELTAHDYVWQLKRLAHPALQSPALGTLGSYLHGLRALSQRLRQELDQVRAARRAAKGPLYDREQDERARPIFLDLDRFDLPGARVIDRYTYQITLTQKYPQLRYWLASLYFAPVPREADEFYAQGPLLSRGLTLDTSPVGTGPYRLETYLPDREITITRNELFRGEAYPAEGSPGDAEAGLLRDAGRTMPFIDRAVYKAEREHIPRWNKFLQGYYDTSRLTSDLFDQSLSFTPSGDLALAPRMAARGMQLVDSVSPLLIYFAWNLGDPDVGGLSPERKKLRQAIAIAVDTQDLNDIFQNGRDVPAHGPVPPGVSGYDAARVNPIVFEGLAGDGTLRRRPLDHARRLLAEAGYPGGLTPSGSPLRITFDTSARAVDKPFLDWMRKQFTKLGIELRIRSMDQSRIQERVAAGDFQLVRSGWQLPYPDAEAAFLPFFGQSPRGFAGNVSGYRSAEFDSLFVRMRSLPDGAERHELITRMTRILQEDCPFIWDVFLRDPLLYQPWITNLKPLTATGWWGGGGTLKYRRIDAASRARIQRDWNRPVLWPALVLLGLLGMAAASLRAALRSRDRRSALPPLDIRRLEP